MLDAPAAAELEDLLTTRAAGEPPLRCAACGAPVTHRAERIEVEGRHEHAFTNPAGERFRIGCFGAAPGARPRGPATGYWSWFEGHDWRVAVCAACGVQLGWHYRTDGGGGFFGLILDALRGDDA